MTEQYLVLGEFGSTDGPYAEEDLREALQKGRVRSRDRIRRIRDGRYFDLHEIIPEAVDISAVRPVPSERIRRKTSDRIEAAKEKSDRVPVALAVATPIAESAIPIAESGSSVPDLPDPGVTVVKPVSWKRSPAVGIAAALVLVVCALAWWEDAEAVMSSEDIQGAWISRSPGNELRRYPLPFVRMVIDKRTVSIETDRQHSTSPYQVEQSFPDLIVVKLDIPHPSLGPKLTFARGQRNLIFLQGERGVPMIHP